MGRYQPTIGKPVGKPRPKVVLFLGIGEPTIGKPVGKPRHPARPDRSFRQAYHRETGREATAAAKRGYSATVAYHRETGREATAADTAAASSSKAYHRETGREATARPCQPSIAKSAYHRETGREATAEAKSSSTGKSAYHRETGREATAMVQRRMRQTEAYHRETGREATAAVEPVHQWHQWHPYTSGTVSDRAPGSRCRLGSTVLRTTFGFGGTMGHSDTDAISAVGIIPPAFVGRTSAPRACACSCARDWLAVAVAKRPTPCLQPSPRHAAGFPVSVAWASALAPTIAKLLRG